MLKLRWIDKGDEHEVEFETERAMERWLRDNAYDSDEDPMFGTPFEVIFS